MEIRVATFNLRYGTAEDGENHWSRRKSAALKMISTLEADVLGLQEVLHFQLQEVLEANTRYEAVGSARDDGISEGEHAPILYDPYRLELIESGTFWFSATPDVPGSRHDDCFHPRICTWARFKDFVVYNLHLDNESFRSRLESVAQLGRTIAKDSLPVIVTGDFNAGESEDSIQAMQTLGLRDTFRMLYANEPAATFHGFGEHKNPDKIDYIWVSPKLEVTKAGIERQQIDGRWPSDHFPVTASIRIS